MNIILMAALKTIKKVFLKIATEKMFEWLLFWSAKMLVDSTKTTKDDEFYAKLKEIYDGKSE